MDYIWYRNPSKSEVIQLVHPRHEEPTKSLTLKQGDFTLFRKSRIKCCLSLMLYFPYCYPFSHKRMYVAVLCCSSTLRSDNTCVHRTF